MFVVMMAVSLKLYKVLRSIELLSDQCCRKLRKKVIYLLTVFVKIIENFTTMVYVVLIFNIVVPFNLFLYMFACFCFFKLFCIFHSFVYSHYLQYKSKFSSNFLTLSIAYVRCHYAVCVCPITGFTYTST